MPNLTPEERAALREWLTRKYALDPEDTLPRDVLRLLDEADRLREGGDVLLDAVTFWARRHAQTLRWARAWKAAAYDLRDQRDGAEAAARFYEADAELLAAGARSQAEMMRAEADALRARAAELERDNARLVRAWEKEQECASQAEAQALDAELRAADIRAFAARACEAIDHLANKMGAYCVWCDTRTVPEPHAPDCALAALLREGEGLGL